MQYPGVGALEAQLADAASSGDYTQLLQALRVDWARLAPEAGPRLRAVFDGIPAQEWQEDAWLVTGYAASYRSVATASRSAAMPYFAAARSLITNDTLLVIDAGMQVHRAAALRSLGRFGEALSIAENALARVEEDTSIRLAWRIPLQAKLSLQAGIAHLHVGDYDRSMSELRLAYGLAGGNLHAWERVECFGSLALLEYTRGNFDASLRFVQEARDAAAGTALLESRFGASAIIAELLIAVERSRAGHAAELAPVVAAAAVRSDWQPLGLYARAAISVITEQYAEGLELLRECRQSYREWSPAGSIVTLSEGLRATLLMRSGAMAAAWDILGSLEPTQHHANCPARFLAHLRLITGDPAGALSTLRDCETLGDAHSSRTLVDVLLIKAAANYELGTPLRGDVAFDRGLRLTARNGMRLPFRLVPPATMRVMVAAASTRSQPEEVVRMLEDVEGLATPLGGAPVLSDREREIVRSLAGDRTANEIADDLFISVNTVKSHLKNVYRKLGVRSRDEAIRRARELGMHVEITSD